MIEGFSRPMGTAYMTIDYQSIGPGFNSQVYNKIKVSSSAPRVTQLVEISI